MASNQNRWNGKKPTQSSSTTQFTAGHSTQANPNMKKFLTQTTGNRLNENSTPAKRMYETAKSRMIRSVTNSNSSSMTTSSTSSPAHPANQYPTQPQIEHMETEVQRWRRNRRSLDAQPEPMSFPNGEHKREILLFDLLRIVDFRRVICNGDDPDHHLDIGEREDDWGVGLLRRIFDNRTTLVWDISRYVRLPRDECRYANATLCNTGYGLKLYSNEFRWLIHNFDIQNTQSAQQFDSFKKADGSLSRCLIATYDAEKNAFNFSIQSPYKADINCVIPIKKLKILQGAKDRWDTVLSNQQRVAEERNKPLVVQGNYRQLVRNPVAETKDSALAHGEIDRAAEPDDESLFNRQECSELSELDYPHLSASTHPLAAAETEIHSDQRMTMNEGLPYINGEPYRPFIEPRPGDDVPDHPSGGDHNYYGLTKLYFTPAAIKINQ